jgi:hypothetical protein
MTDQRAHVALLVDFANLRQQLAPFDGAESTADDLADDGPGGREIARALVRFAGGVGRVGLARAYADWSRDPEASRELNGTRLAPVLVPATQDGEDRSHIQLTVDAMEVLYNGDEPDAFILVSGDPSLVPLVQAIRSDGSEVIVVAADAGQAEEMSAEADQFLSFEEVLAGKEAESVAPRAFRAERGSYGKSGGYHGGGRARRGNENGRDRGSRDFDRGTLLTEPTFDDYDWSRFVRLIDELEQRLPFVGVRYLVNKVLGPHNCGIEDPRIKRDLINQAVDEGLIEMYTVGNVNDRTDPVTACRLDRRSGIVVDVLGPDSQAAAAPEDEEEAPLPSRYEAYSQAGQGQLGD